jgi:hypothetical protein
VDFASATRPPCCSPFAEEHRAAPLCLPGDLQCCRSATVCKAPVCCAAQVARRQEAAPERRRAAAPEARRGSPPGRRAASPPPAAAPRVKPGAERKSDAERTGSGGQRAHDTVDDRAAACSPPRMPAAASNRSHDSSRRAEPSSAAAVAKPKSATPRDAKISNGGASKATLPAQQPAPAAQKSAAAAVTKGSSAPARPGTGKAAAGENACGVSGATP